MFKLLIESVKKRLITIISTVVVGTITTSGIYIHSYIESLLNIQHSLVVGYENIEESCDMCYTPKLYIDNNIIKIKYGKE